LLLFDEILRMARHFKGSGVILRLIEYMDVGTYNGWKLDVVPSAEDVRCIAAAMAARANRCQLSR
jgi:cyclic pyranopterin phosphate synthase